MNMYFLHTRIDVTVGISPLPFFIFHFLFIIIIIFLLKSRRRRQQISILPVEFKMLLSTVKWNGNFSTTTWLRYMSRNGTKHMHVVPIRFGCWKRSLIELVCLVVTWLNDATAVASLALLLRSIFYKEVESSFFFIYCLLVLINV